MGGRRRRRSEEEEDRQHCCWLKTSRSAATQRRRPGGGEGGWPAGRGEGGDRLEGLIFIIRPSVFSSVTIMYGLPPPARPIPVFQLHEGATGMERCLPGAGPASLGWAGLTGLGRQTRMDGEEKRTTQTTVPSAAPAPPLPSPPPPRRAVKPAGREIVPGAGRGAAGRGGPGVGAGQDLVTRHV